MSEQARAELKRFYPDEASAWGDGGEFGHRIQIVRPELSGVEFYLDLEKLHPRVQEFVLALLRFEDVDEAASEVGFNAETVAMLMPRLHRVLRRC